MSEEIVHLPSPEQQNFLDWVQNGSGSGVLEAVAGAGKTTTLVKGVALMKGTVFIGAYNKKIAEEIKGKLAKNGVTHAKAGTFHSAGFSALWRGNKDIVVDEDKVHKIVKSVIEPNSDYDIPEFRTAICKLVSLAKQTGFYIGSMIPTVQPRYWVELVKRYDVAESLPDDGFYEQYLGKFADQVLRISNADYDTVDFDDMIYLALLRNTRLFQNDWVLIDEAQDTNAIRRELAKRMLKRGGRMVAVGDPHQAIYGFTGADSESLNTIKNMFGAETLHLSVSFRCPRSVVATANEYVSHIKPAETAPEGKVLEMRYREMVQAAQPGDAVICRFNAPLIDLCFKLIREGKPAKIEGRSIGEGLVALVSKWKLRTINELDARLKIWNEKEMKKMTGGDKPDEAKIARHQDKFDTVVVLIDRAREKGYTRLDELKEMVRDMFADVGASSSLIVLCSVHRSKGLEWPRVFILGRKELMPSTRVSQEWQMQQEINLCYVAVTRAQETLVDVWLPTEADLRKKTEEKKVETAPVDPA